MLKISEQALEHQHKIQWEKANIIGRESSYKKLKVHESIEMIKRGRVISAPSHNLSKLWTTLLQTEHSENQGRGRGRGNNRLRHKN
jgi:hypothetical protein